jgi:hypothetical protein
MASSKKLSREQIERLMVILQAKQDEADSLGETAERNRLAAAFAALASGLREGGSPPAAIVEEYAHLLDAVGETVVSGTAPPVVPEESPFESDPFDASNSPSDDGILPDAGEPVEEESEEARELRRELGRVTTRLQAAESGNPGDLALARAETSRLLERYPVEPDVVALNAQVVTLVNRRIAEARRMGDQLRGEGNFEAARRQYEIVQQLGGDDGSLGAAILEIDRAIAAQSSDADLNRLARALGERFDMQLLGRAVRDAEVRQDEGRLPPHLVERLKEARQHWDDSRRQQGEMTTFARFGDLKARRQAVRRISDEMTKLGRTRVFDSGRQEYMSAGEALNEAQKYYLQKSEELANYELNIVKGMLPGHPEAAQAHLEGLLKKRPPEEGEADEQYVRDFAPETVSSLLEPKLTEVREMVAQLKLAEVEAAKVDVATDELTALRLLLGAYRFYPGMLGLETRLEQARYSAARRLGTQMESFHNIARPALDAEQFDEALAALKSADETPNAWPESDLPPNLVQLKSISETLRKDLEARRRLRADFDRLAAQIRANVLDPNERVQGMEMYQQVNGDPRFGPLQADLTELRTFVNQHKGTGEQLAEIMRLAREENWEEVQRLAKTIQESGKAGERADEVERLLQQATRELEIAAALRDLVARRVPQAHDRLSALRRRTPKGPALEELEAIQAERLKDEQEMISAAMKDETMPPLFKEAAGLAAQAEPAKQFAALRLFRHVAGDHGQTPDEGWSPYVLSAVTGEAINKAAELRNTLRKSLLEKVAQAAKKVRAGTAKAGEADVALAADYAHLLRDAALLDTPDETADANELILFQGMVDARSKEANGEWAEAVAVWQKLNAVFPHRVEEETRRARIQLALRTADGHIRKGQAEEAQAVIDAALAARGIGESWELFLKYVDIHAVQGDFGLAAKAVRRVEDLLPTEDKRHAQVSSQVKAKQAWLQREQIIVEAEQRAAAERDKGHYKEALTAISNALDNSKAADSRRLTQMRVAIYNEGSAKLLAEAQRHLAAASQDSKTQAVVLLAELDEVERLAGVPDGQGRAQVELKPLQAAFAPIIRATLLDATNFSPQAHPLDQAIAKATNLSTRLQTFLRVAPALSVELGTLKTDLEREGPRMSATVDQLLRLRTLLSEVDDRNPASETGQQAKALWDDAAISGNFSRLETYRGLVDATGLGLSPDAIDFQLRLDEWKEIRATLMDRIAAVGHNFNGGIALPRADGQSDKVENFGQVLNILRTLKQLPPTRSDGHTPWLQLGQESYTRIYKLMGSLVVISDVMEGQTLSGWEHVEEATKIRLDEVNAWTVWEHAYSTHMQRAEELRIAAEALPPTVTLVQKRDAWDKVAAALEEAQAALDRPVLLEQEEVAVRTRWAKLIEERAKAARYAAERWRYYIQAETPHQSALAFPTAQQFSDASRNSRASLEALVTRAQTVGYSNEDERKRLEHFSRVLADMAGQKARASLLQKLWKKD